MPRSHSRFLVRTAALALSASLAVSPVSASDVTGTIAKAGSAALSVGGSVDIAPASATLKRGLAALDKGDVKAALAARAALRAGTLERKVMAWSIALHGKDVDAATLYNIASDLPNWPGQSALRANLEKALVEESSDAALIGAFSRSVPESKQARLALAEAHIKAGNRKAARQALAPVWHGETLSKRNQSRVLKNLSKALTRDDHRARIDMLISRDRFREAERIAPKAGLKRVVAARVAAARKSRSAKQALAAIPRSQASHPHALIAKAQVQRRAGAISAAAKTLLKADAKVLSPRGADDLWIEKRILASDLLEAGKAQTAYSLARRTVARSARRLIDQNFYAGWIALRKLNRADAAAAHFRAVLTHATTPLSRSRGHYWLGRALEQAGKRSEANSAFAAAARHDTTYYGQLAAAKIGQGKIRVADAAPTQSDRTRFPRYELVQAIAKLESAGQADRARIVYRHLSRHLETPGEIALLAARAEARGDHALALQCGKLAFNRGMAVDKVAYPLGAIPTNINLGKAGLPLAYAISRQESTFRIDARSPANALGLMQLLPGTAKQTARRIGLRYSKAKLTRDAAYNARLGTAYLDEQLKRFDNSLILTFIAYNAGPRMVDEWIARNGDPRGRPLEEVIDWIEMIPFAETRNYVQRVMENYQVYKRRLSGSRLTIEKDLTHGRGA